MTNSAIYTAPFDDDGFMALYVPRTGGSMNVVDDPRVSILLNHGFKHAATHGMCAVLFPADLPRAKSVLAAA